MNLTFKARLVLFATLFLSSQLVLIWATGIIEGAGGTVPDLMPLGGGVESTRAVFDQFQKIDPALYLTVLWTADILFPVGYGGFLHTLLKRLGHFTAFPLCAMTMDFVENIFATLIILVGPNEYFLGAFTFAHTVKFATLVLSFAALVAVSWQSFKWWRA